MNGYDQKTGHLFVWNKEFKYAGRAINPPGDFFSPANDVIASLVGAFFLGGLGRFSKAFWSDGSNEVASMVGLDGGRIRIHPANNAPVSPHDRVVLCGPIVASPVKVAEFCQRFPANSMFVCHLTDELPAFGCLAEALCDKSLDRPRRASLFQPYKEPLPFPCR